MRIDKLEEKEKKMLNDLQTTMKEHNMLMVREKQGDLSTEIVDETISKFNLLIK